MIYILLIHAQEIDAQFASTFLLTIRVNGDERLAEMHARKISKTVSKISQNIGVHITL